MVKKGVAWLKKKADAEFSKYIRHRDGEKRLDGWYSKCITCGAWKPLVAMQNGHFVSRKASVLRYDEENCNAQCVADNMFKQGDQYQYAIELDKKYGDGTAVKLHAQRMDTHKWTTDELEQIIKDAKEQVAWYVENN